MTPETECELHKREAARAFCEAQIELDYRAGISRRCHWPLITQDRWEELDAIFGCGDLQRVATQAKADPGEWYQFVFERDMVERHMRDRRVAIGRAEAWRGETADERADNDHECRQRGIRDFRESHGLRYGLGHDQ